jgi:hypothetical protein
MLAWSNNIEFNRKLQRLAAGFQFLTPYFNMCWLDTPVAAADPMHCKTPTNKEEGGFSTLHAKVLLPATRSCHSAV